MLSQNVFLHMMTDTKRLNRDILPSASALVVLSLGG